MSTQLVFFSYARSDAKFALRLAKDLRSAGANIWVDQLDIRGGEHWDLAVEKALKSSQCLLVILSPASVASNNVMDEVSFGLEEKKRIVPILHINCVIPFRLKRVQYIDFTTDYDSGLIHLLNAFNMRSQQKSSDLPTNGGNEQIIPHSRAELPNQIGAAVAAAQASGEIRQMLVGRRALLYLTGSLALSLLVVRSQGYWKTWFMTRLAHNPRFRRKKKPAIVTMGVNVGFYSNKRSKIIQYVSAGISPNDQISGTSVQRHTMVGVRLTKDRLPKEENFALMPQSKIVGHVQQNLRFNRGIQTHIIERAAVDNWAIGKHKEACEILHFGVVTDLRNLAAGDIKKPKTRLYYLLAKFALISRQKHWIKKMEFAIAESGAHEQLLRATQSWSNSKSRWRRNLVYIQQNGGRSSNVG